MSSLKSSFQTFSYGPVGMSIEGIDEVQKVFDTLADHLKAQAAFEMARRAGEAVAEWMRENVDAVLNQHPTGTLRDSIFATTLTNEEGAVCFVGPNMTALPYTQIHEYGGLIRAKHAPVLRWHGYDGRWHAAKQVYIPARPYIRPAVDDHQEEIIDIYNQVLDEAIAEEIAESGAW